MSLTPRWCLIYRDKAGNKSLHLLQHTARTLRIFGLQPSIRTLCAASSKQSTLEHKSSLSQSSTKQRNAYPPSPCRMALHRAWLGLHGHDGRRRVCTAEYLRTGFHDEVWDVVVLRCTVHCCATLSIYMTGMVVGVAVAIRAALGVEEFDWTEAADWTWIGDGLCSMKEHEKVTVKNKCCYPNCLLDGIKYWGLSAAEGCGPTFAQHKQQRPTCGHSNRLQRGPTTADSEKRMFDAPGSLRRYMLHMISTQLWRRRGPDTHNSIIHYSSA